MTATAESYRPRYYSEIVKEAAGSYDDCAICSGLALYDAATLGEGVTRDDGRLMDTIRLRELRAQAGLRPNGPLRLNDIADYLRFVSTKAGLNPPFELDYYPGHPGGTLKVTWDQFKAKVRGGSIAVLLGNPIGVKDPNSPLRTKTNNDDYGHAIAVFAGNATGARVFDPLTRHPENWPGERVSWDDLYQFTSAKNWAFGSPTTIACALAEIGGETALARYTRSATRLIKKRNDELTAQKAQTALATDERDQARRELAALNETHAITVAQLQKSTADLTACQQAKLPDCAECEDEVATLRDVITRVRALVTL